MIQQDPKFSCLSYAMNLITGEIVEILEIQYFQEFGYGYRCRSVLTGKLYEVNEQAYYPELILSNLPLIAWKGEMGKHDYLINVISPITSEFCSIMYAIDGVFRTGNKKVGYFSNLIGDFVCPTYALKIGISLVMEELQNERQF